TELTAAKNTQVVADYYQLTTKNGKKGFYAKKGDLLLGFAIKNRVRYGKLLELNDLPDAPLEADMFIYLERKGKTGVNEMHVVKNGETLLQISQHEGILLSELQALNQLSKGEEPAVGTVLQLQKRVETKPSLEVAPGSSDEAQSKNA